MVVGRAEIANWSVRIYGGGVNARTYASRYNILRSIWKWNTFSNICLLDFNTRLSGKYPFLQQEPVRFRGQESLPNEGTTFLLLWCVFALDIAFGAGLWVDLGLCPVFRIFNLGLCIFVA